MARDWILLTMICVGCTEPLTPKKTPPTTRMEGKSQSAKDAGAGAGGASAGKQAQGGAKAKGAADARTDDDDVMASDAGSEPADARQTPDASAMRDAAQDGSADAADAPQAVVGTWTGQVRDPLNRVVNSCVVVTQVGTPGDGGHSSYTGAFTCQCRLNYRETVGDLHSFDEIVMRGMGCPPVGILTLEVSSDDKLKYNWYLNPGEIPEGVGTLSRVDHCE